MDAMFLVDKTGYRNRYSSGKRVIDRYKTVINQD